ncbi:MAG: nitroreductase family protein [Candidatus Eisenbacteria bacterium]
MSVAAPQLSVTEAIRHRRSIRAYETGAIPQADLDAILEAAALAPSAFNLQPWRFVVVRDPAVKAQLAEAAYRQPQVTAAPAVVVLYTDMADTLATLDELVRPGTPPEKAAKFTGMIRGIFEPQTEEQRETWAANQGHIALGFLLLAAEGHGYATSPMGGFEPDKVKALLGLPAHVRIPALVAIGRAAEDGLPHHRQPLARLARTV